MTIIHVNGYFKEDVIYQENLLTKGQLELGHNVILITSRYEPEMKINIGNRKKPAGEINYGGLTVVRVDDFFEVKKNALVLIKSILPHLYKYKPQMIFFHDVSHLLFYGVFYKLRNPGVLIYVDFHSDTYNSGNSVFGKLYHLFWRFFFRIFDKTFNKYFGVAPESVSFIKEVYKLPSDKIELLPLPGIKIPSEVALLHRVEFRKRFGFDETLKLIVHTGKLPQGKETLLLLKAFTLINDENIRLVIAGSIDDHFDKEFKSFQEIDNRIFFLSWLNPDNITKLLCASDLMVQPGSLSHTFVEAICCGLPIILNDTPQGRNLTSYGNGLLLEKKEVNSLRILIEKAFVEEEYKLLKKNAVIASSYFDYIHIAKLSLG